jgi:hypothetical protein
MIGFDEYVERERVRYGVQSEGYDEFAAKLENCRPGLTRSKGESSKEFCRRVLLQRRPAANKPLGEAFRAPGRRARKPNRP